MSSFFIFFLFNLIFLVSCNRPKVNWINKAPPPEDRALLFSMFGFPHLDSSMGHSDLVWGQQIRNFNGYSSIQKEEFVLVSCRHFSSKVFTDYGNLYLKDSNSNCENDSEFESIFISKQEGGKTIQDALPIPFKSASYIVNDSVNSNAQARWYRIDVPQAGKLSIRLNSSESVTGKLYQDRNENSKFEFEELIDAAAFEDSKQSISVNVDKSRYFFVVQYEGDDVNYKVDFKTLLVESPSDKGANIPSEALTLDVSETEILISDSLSEFDALDYYRFELQEASGLKIRLHRTAGDGDGDLALYHDLNEDGLLSNDEIVAVSEASGDEALTFDQAAKGKWFLKVSRFRGSLHYSLAIQALKSVSSDLLLLVKKENHHLNVYVKNLGPSAANEVSLVVRRSENSKLILPDDEWNKIDSETYSHNFHHIAVSDEVKIVLEGEGDEIVTLEVLTKDSDPNRANNAAAILF